MKNVLYPAIILGVVLASSGCNDPGQTEASAPAAVPQAAASQEDPHANMTSRDAPTGQDGTMMAGSNQGAVVQVIDAGSYTYVEVNTGAGNVWVAGNKTDVKVGDKVAWKDGAVMRNFTSKVLNRQFESVMFVSALISPDALPKASHGVIVSVESAGGYSYIEVDTESGRHWLAVTERPLKQGSRIEWADGMVMRDFPSKALKRTFDAIMFVGDIKVVG